MTEELDIEQNRCIREVESRLNTLENQIAGLIARLDQATQLLKVVGIGVGAMIGLDVQGMVM